MENFSMKILSIKQNSNPDYDDDDDDDDDDPSLKYNRSIHVEPFHRQRRIDGSLSFNEQIITMQHILSTNGLDGKSLDDNPNGGIWKEIIHTGIGQKPTLGASVRLHYYSYFEHHDEPFDTSFKRRRPLEFRLGKCEVLPGLDFAVNTMQRRERSKFIISSDLLYGELGCAPHIPESAWCLYIIELLTTNEPSTIIHDDQLTRNQSHIDDFAKRIRLAQSLRNTGNEEYANGQLDRALRSYNKARKLIHNKVTLIDGKHEEQYHQLLLKLHLNSAQCYLRLDNFDKCLRACRDALIIEPNNLKALYRASVSLRSLNQLEQAEKYLIKALSIDPQNREILIEVDKLNSALQTMNKKTTNSKESIEIDDILSCLHVTDDFKMKIESLLQFHDTSQLLIIHRENFSETEFYYIELYAKKKKLIINRINNDTLHICK